METDFRSRGVLVSTAGFVLSSLGLLLSILTSFLGQDTVVALTRKLNSKDDDRSGHPAPRTRAQPVRRLIRVASDSSLVVVPLPTISVTLHRTGNSVSSSRHHAISITTPTPPTSPRAAVNFAAPPPPPSRSTSHDHWLALPPLKTRSKKGVQKRRTLNRSTSSPQLTSFAAAGATFSLGSGGPSGGCVLPETDSETPKKKTKKSRTRSRLCLRKSDRIINSPSSIERSLTSSTEEWETVYVNAQGSPNTMSAPPIDTTSSVEVKSDSGGPKTPPLPSPARAQTTPDTSTSSKPHRPQLRKAKTLGDLLRRLPNTPGPDIPSPDNIEATTKKAFAFASKSKTILSSASSSSLPAEKESTVKSSIIKCPLGKGSSHLKEEVKTRKRTQPYEAPYFWVPPDQVMAQRGRSSGVQEKDVGRDAVENVEAGMARSNPVSRVGSREKLGSF